MLRENRMHRCPKLPDSFPVNDPEFENPLLATELDVVQNDGLYVLRSKRVEIKDSVDRQIYRFGAFIYGLMLWFHSMVLFS